MTTAQTQPSHRAGTAAEGTGGGESTLTVIVALAINVSIAVMKVVAGVLTGSAAMLAEAAHSVADSSTEGMLLAALRRCGTRTDQPTGSTRSATARCGSSGRSSLPYRCS